MSTYVYDYAVVKTSLKEMSIKISHITLISYRGHQGMLHHVHETRRESISPYRAYSYRSLIRSLLVFKIPGRSGNSQSWRGFVHVDSASGLTRIFILNINIYESYEIPLSNEEPDTISKNQRKLRVSRGYIIV